MRMRISKPVRTIEFGGGVFKVEFFTDSKRPGGNYMRIKTVSGVMEHSIGGYTFGYLMAALEQGREEEVHAYCVLIWRVGSEIFQDQQLADDIIKAVCDRDNRLMAEAEKSVENDEARQMADEEFMRDVAKYADADKKGGKALRESWKNEIKEILTDEREQK